MRFLFILDSVEAPAAPNPRLGRRLAESVAAAGHMVDILELWDGETPPPSAAGCRQYPLGFAGVRQMNRALENGSKTGSPLPLRLLRLAAHPAAVDAALRQLVLKKPRRTTDTLREIERLDAQNSYTHIVAVCAPYRAAFALEQARTSAKKLLWQLDPYAANRDYRAPGGYERERQLLGEMAAAFITRQAAADYAAGGALAAMKDKVHVLDFPSLVPPGAGSSADGGAGKRCVFCGTLYPNLRTPDFALALFTALGAQGWTLVMAGGGWEHFTPQAAAASKAMQGRLQITGPVPPAQAAAYQQGAQVLLSIGNTVDNQLPSKLFDYFAAGKPVLHLASTDADPCLPYLARYPLALVLREGDGAVEQAAARLRRWLGEVDGKTLAFSEVAAIYPELTPAAVAQQFLAVAEHC